MIKKNLHVAVRCTLPKVLMKIETYPSKYPTPKYLLFIKRMLELGFEVKIYVAKVSKYVFVITPNNTYKIRFSNHKPAYHKQMQEDSDYYVGISHTNVMTTDEIINIISHKENICQ